jgi:cell division protein FtsL
MSDPRPDMMTRLLLGLFTGLISGFVAFVLITLFAIGALGLMALQSSARSMKAESEAAAAKEDAKAAVDVAKELQSEMGRR